MKNCLILGSGRSGTSLAAGVLSKAGYFMGDHLNPANETNPKGQFEDREVNSINEELLAQITPVRPSNFLGEAFFKSRPVFGQRWLARLPLETSIPSPSHLENKMKVLVEHEPFCFKDPRFSYTLRVWRPFLKNTVFVCVFRHPGATVSSILRQRKRVPHLRSFSINSKQAFQVWELMYSHILRIHYPEGGSWVFLHYDQFFDGSAFEKLEDKLETEVDRNFADPRLNRSKKLKKVNDRILFLYGELCTLANFENKHK